jgi:hypothetical protein
MSVDKKKTNQEESSEERLFIWVSLLKIYLFLFSCQNFRSSGLFRFRILRFPWTVDRPISKPLYRLYIGPREGISIEPAIYVNCVKLCFGSELQVFVRCLKGTFFSLCTVNPMKLAFVLKSKELQFVNRFSWNSLSELLGTEDTFLFPVVWTLALQSSWHPFFNITYDCIQKECVYMHVRIYTYV